MTTIVRVVLTIFSLQVLLISDAKISWAQVDPTKALIGTWEGQIDSGGGNTQRTLIINSVKSRADDEWVARGRYGLLDEVTKDAGGQAMTVSRKENDIYVELLGGGGGSRNPITLKLIGENKLEGTINMVLAKGKAADRRIKFEKVPPKAGDVK